jgi:hypothetical protein
MNRILTLALALSAGLIGGLLSRYIAPESVHAQAQTIAPKEIRAQSFVLVDEKGVPRGIFAIEQTGFPTLEASAQDGHVYTLTHQVSWTRPRDFKPTLLPTHP